MSKVRIDLTLSEAAAIVDSILGGDKLSEINDKADPAHTARQAARKVGAQLHWVRNRRTAEKLGR